MESGGLGRTVFVTWGFVSQFSPFDARRAALGMTNVSKMPKIARSEPSGIVSC